MTSAVLIVTIASLDSANALGEAMGWGPGNYSVPLSADAKVPATHYGCRAEVQQGFIDMLITPPEDNPLAVAVINNLIYDFSDGEDGYSHFTRVTTENSLKRVEYDV